MSAILTKVTRGFQVHSKKIILRYFKTVFDRFVLHSLSFRFQFYPLISVYKIYLPEKLVFYRRKQDYLAHA